MREEIQEAIDGARKRIGAINGLYGDDFLTIFEAYNLKSRAIEYALESIEEEIKE